MGATLVDLRVASPADRARTAEIKQVLVDTGAELSWLPADVLRSINVEPVKERRFVVADRRELVRPTGYAILFYEDYETIDEIVFAEPDDLRLLGARTLEGLGLAVDPLTKKLYTVPTIVASVPSAPCQSGLPARRLDK